MNLLAINIPCWLIPILVGLISAILGYLLGRLLRGGDDTSRVEVDVDGYKNRISKLEKDLAACKARKTPSNIGSGSASSLAAGAATTAGVVSGAKAVFGKKIRLDDLTVVEGIGPKIEELFHNHDVNTWAALAACSVDKCQEVLTSGGKRFELHNPRTWPDQSKLAASGQWQKLKELQSTLKRGM